MRVLFVSASERARQSGSYKSRGIQMAKAFETLGAVCRHVLHSKVISMAKDFDVIIFIKCAPPNNGFRAFYDALVVMDIVDNLELLNKKYFDLVDAVIFPNVHSQKMFQKQCTRSKCIIHHYDPDFAVPTDKSLSEPRFIYVGHQAYLPGHAHANPDIHKVCNDYDGVPQIIHKFNVHLNLRKPGTQDFNFKPNSKVSFAASCVGSVILTTRERSTLQFRSMKDYPYYVEGTSKEQVNVVMDYIRATYNGPVWHKALACLADVRSRSTIEAVAGEYYAFLKSCMKKLPASKKQLLKK